MFDDARSKALPDHQVSLVGGGDGAESAANPAREESGWVTPDAQPNDECVSSYHAMVTEELFGIGHQRYHRASAKGGFRADDRRRHLISSKKVEREESGCARNAEWRMPRQEVDDLRRWVAIEAPEGGHPI